jgi:hypothetical protein
MYVTIVPQKVGETTIYKIKVDNNPDLNDYYKKKVFKTLQEVKDEYEKSAKYVVNGKDVEKPYWTPPREIKTNKAYSIQGADGKTILSPIQMTESNGWSNIINELSFVSSGVGAEVTIEEERENENNSEEVQKKFAQKAKLVVSLGGKKIAVIPQNSEVRQLLETREVGGKTRLAPTKANINKVIQKDFDRQAPMLLSDWLVDFITANGKMDYKVGYVYYDEVYDGYVLRDAKGTNIHEYPMDKEPLLGAAYLQVEDSLGKKTRFALQTPKLKDVTLLSGSPITESELMDLLSQVDKQFLKGEGRELYANIISGLKLVINKSTSSRVKELGGLMTEGRSAYTEEQLLRLDELPEFSPTLQDSINQTISDFLLNRIITLTNNSEGLHLITANPRTIFLDNTIEVRDVEIGGKETSIKTKSKKSEGVKEGVENQTKITTNDTKEHKRKSKETNTEGGVKSNKRRGSLEINEWDSEATKYRKAAEKYRGLTPNNPLEAIYQYFLQGGKISSNILIELFGANAKGQAKYREIRARLSIMNNDKGAISIDGLSDSILEFLPQSMREMYETSDGSSETRGVVAEAIRGYTNYRAIYNYYIKSDESLLEDEKHLLDEEDDPLPPIENVDIVNDIFTDEERAFYYGEDSFDDDEETIKRRQELGEKLANAIEEINKSIEENPFNIPKLQNISDEAFLSLIASEGIIEIDENCK